MTPREKVRAQALAFAESKIGTESPSRETAQDAIATAWMAGYDALEAENARLTKESTTRLEIATNVLRRERGLLDNAAKTETKNAQLRETLKEIRGIAENRASFSMFPQAFAAIVAIISSALDAEQQLSTPDVEVKT